MTDFSAAQKLLESTNLTELCKKDQKIVLLEHNTTIGDALKTLAKHNILSAPMVMYPDIEEVQGGDMSPQLLGWIDVADVMRAFLQHLTDAGHRIPTQMLALMNLLEKEGPVFSDRLLVTIRGAPGLAAVFAMSLCLLKWEMQACLQHASQTARWTAVHGLPFSPGAPHSWQLHTLQAGSTGDWCTGRQLLLAVDHPSDICWRALTAAGCNTPCRRGGPGTGVPGRHF
jgi:hypothetical protein